MQYYRCKCSNRKGWGSMPFADCQVCEDCGSTLAIHPSFHSEPQPHEWVTRYDERTGKPYEVCLRCYENKKEE